MSKGGGGSSGGTQTQMSQTQLPGWVENAAMQNYGDATRASYGLMQPYGGQRVADMTPGMQSLINMLQGNVGSTNPAFAQAQGATGNLMNYNPTMVDPQMLRNTDLAPYMSPFTKSVIDPTMSLMEQSRRQALGQIGDQATQARAFGGSRQGISEGVTNAQSELQKGQFAGQLYGQNFLQGQAAATGDIQRNLQGQLANQQAGMAGAQFRGGMANQLGNLATQGQQNFLTGTQAAMGGQQMLTEQQQRQLDATQQLYGEQRQYPLDQLAIRTAQLSNSPYGQTSYTQRPGPSTDPLGQGLGTASSLLGMAGMAKYLGLFSDRRMKTDIDKVGRDRATGLDIYSYRYKDDPKTYPKVVGPMAQDIQKKFPDQVFKAGKYLAVNGNFLSGVMANHA
jgi:hypothetical protein